jgi:ribosomal 30S subunit maturation factor RimM
MNMWFLNKETGCAWEIADQELIQRLQGNSSYEQVDALNNVELTIKTTDAKSTKRNDKELS